MAALATIPYGFETLIFLPFPSPRPVGPLSHSSFFLAVPRVTWMSPGSLCMPSCGSESETVISASSLQPMLATEEWTEDRREASHQEPGRVFKVDTSVIREGPRLGPEMFRRRERIKGLA